MTAPILTEVELAAFREEVADRIRGGGLASAHIEPLQRWLATVEYWQLQCTMVCKELGDVRSLTVNEMPNASFVASYRETLARAEAAEAARDELRAEVERLRAGIRQVLPSQPGKWSEGAGDENDPICLLLCQIEFLENRIADMEDERDISTPPAEAEAKAPMTPDERLRLIHEEWGPALAQMAEGPTGPGPYAPAAKSEPVLRGTQPFCVRCGYTFDDNCTCKCGWKQEAAKPEPVCAGPFVDARDCPVHRKDLAPVKATGLEDAVKAWRRLDDDSRAWNIDALREAYFNAHQVDEETGEAGVRLLRAAAKEV